MSEGETRLDLLPPLSRPLAVSLARELAVKKVAASRVGGEPLRCNVFQLERAIRDDEVIPDLLALKPAELERRTAAWWKVEKARQAEHRLKGARSSVASLVPPEGPAVDRLGRSSEPVRDRHEPRERDEDEIERESIAMEARR